MTQAVLDDSHHDAYLVDPIDPRELAAMVRSLLRLQRVEADLRDSEERLLLAQDAAGLAILDWVIETSNTFVHSENLVELFDLALEPGEALEPTQLVDRIHPDDIGALIEEFTSDSASAQNFETEFRIVRRDGSVRWIASRGRFFLGAGRDAGADAFALLRRHGSQGLRARQRRTRLHRRLVDRRDRLGRPSPASATSWNAGAERLFGIPASEMIGQPFSDAFPGP